MNDHGHDDRDHDPCDHGFHGDHEPYDDHGVHDAFHELHGHLPCDDHHGDLRDHVHENDHYGVLRDHENDLLGHDDRLDLLNVHVNGHVLLVPHPDGDHDQGLRLHHLQR